MSRGRADWSVVIVVSFAAIAISWMFLVPPGAGADEPSHLIRAAAVIRGQVSGTPDPGAIGTNRGEIFEVPARTQVPQPGCYAFQPPVAVSCAAPVAPADGDLPLVSTSDEYPIWGHLAYGLGSLLPGVDSIWPVRLVGVAVAVALIGAALAHSRSIAGRAGILLAATPTAYATIATVNPSTFAIAGAIGCWVAVLRSHHTRIATSQSWWFAASWAALILTRRDGIAWATIIVAIASLYRDRSAMGWFALLYRPAGAVVALTTAVMIVWGVTGDSRLSQFASLSPLLLVATDAGQILWRRATSARSRILLAAGVGVAAMVFIWISLISRPGGWDPDLARVVWTFADDHLVQAVGVFGWLDVAIPGLAIGGFLVALGALFGAAILNQPRSAVWGFAAGAVAVGTAWWLELLSGSGTGQYWQGRYSLPLLVGVPLILATTRLEPGQDRRLGLGVAGMALIVLNVGAWAGARRWGVGVEGSLAPWRWGTVHQPIPPVLLLAVMAGASAALLVGLSRSDAHPRRS